MNFSIKDVGLIAAGLYLLHLAVTQLVTAISNRRFAAAHGCKPPYRVGCSLSPIGLRFFLGLIKAAERKEHVQYLCGGYARLGRNTFETGDLGRTIIRTIEPENVKTLLATKFKDFDLGPSRQFAFHELLGDGVFTLDGKGWEYSRAMLRPQFVREQVADVEMLDVHVTRLLDMMKAVGTAEVDLQPWIFGLTLDTATEFLFGESAESLVHGDADLKGFAYSFNEAQQWIMWKLRLQQMAFFTPSAMAAVNGSCHAFVDRYVNKTLAAKAAKAAAAAGTSGDGEAAPPKRYVFLDAVAESNRDPKALRDQMLNILLAGRDTTAGLIGWTLYSLSRHPEIYRKLRAELEAAFGTGKPGVWRRPTFETLKDVTYLRYVLNEGIFPFLPLQ